MEGFFELTMDDECMSPLVRVYVIQIRGAQPPLRFVAPQLPPIGE